MHRLLFKDRGTGSIIPLWSRYSREDKGFKFYTDIYCKNEADTSNLEEVMLEGEDSPKLPFTLFGIECGKGWYKLIEPIVNYIDNYNKDKENLEDMIHIHQIKEKFGGLRVYLSFGTRELYDMINEAEEKSFEICESCGKEADLSKKGVETGVGQTFGWVETICTDCLKKRTESEQRQYYWYPCNSEDELYYFHDGTFEEVPEEEKEKL